MEINLTWLGIFICILLSGIFSGLNIGLFGLARLRLESEAEAGNKEAQNVLKMRADSNFLLTTLLWGNVSVNTLLALLTDSVMSGVAAFFFSTILITFMGEIIPQAWFSRNALKVGSALRPLVRLFQFILFPIARPTATMLDRWLGSEGLHYFSEETLKAFLKKHIGAAESEIEKLEGTGALNFLKMDDLPISKEGESIHPESILKYSLNLDLPVIPEVNSDTMMEFVESLAKITVKWVIFINEDDFPVLVLNSDAYVKAYYAKMLKDRYQFCHRPIIFEDGDVKLADIAYKFKVESEHEEDDVIDNDIVLLWSEKDKRVITGTDILGRLFRGIVQTKIKNKNVEESIG